MWTKLHPNKEGFYWTRRTEGMCGSYNTIVMLSQTSEDTFDVYYFGDDCYYSVDEVELWGPEAIEPI